MASTPNRFPNFVTFDFSFVTMLMTDDENPYLGVYPARYSQPELFTSPGDLDDLDTMSSAAEAPARSRHPQYSPRHHRKAVNKPRNLRDQSSVPRVGKDEGFLLEGNGTGITPKQRIDAISNGKGATDRRETKDEDLICLPRIPSSLERNPKLYHAGLQKIDQFKPSKLSNQKNEKLQKEIKRNMEKYIFTLQRPGLVPRGSKASENVHNLFDTLKLASFKGAGHNSRGESIEVKHRKQKLYGNTSGMKRNTPDLSTQNNHPKRHVAAARKTEGFTVPKFQLGPTFSVDK